MASNSNSRYSDATFSTILVRTTLNLVRARGHSPERICKGLGFSLEELGDGNFRLSYRQISLMVRRAMQTLDEPALGLSSGALQTVIRWGLPGLAMLTCKTLGQAVRYVVDHQADAGALLLHQWTVLGKEFILEVSPLFFDSELETFLTEDSFASAVAVVRQLVGPRFRPVRVELAYARPSYARTYSTFFQCPIHFDCHSSRLVSDASWLDTALPGYDEFSCEPLRAQITSLMADPKKKSDLLESLTTHLRVHLDEPRALVDTAREWNISERTLRRRLTELGVSYRDLVSQIRYERAIDLLRRGRMSVGEVSRATGFGDVRSFRRAFKRWSGALPSAIAGTPLEDAFHLDADQTSSTAPPYKTTRGAGVIASGSR